MYRTIPYGRPDRPGLITLNAHSGAPPAALFRSRQRDGAMRRRKRSARPGGPSAVLGADPQASRGRRWYVRRCRTDESARSWRLRNCRRPLAPGSVQSCKFRLPKEPRDLVCRYPTHDLIHVFGSVDGDPLRRSRRRDAFPHGQACRRFPQGGMADWHQTNRDDRAPALICRAPRPVRPPPVNPSAPANGYPRHTECIVFSPAT